MTVNKRKEIFIKTPVRKYNIKDLNFNSIPDINILKELGLDLSESQYSKDPDKFLKKLKGDYK